MSSYDDFLSLCCVIMIILLAIVIAMFVVSALSSPSPPPIPLSCGITEENKSESYTIMVMVGKVMTPQTHYHHDLVCTNGTTIFEYRR